MTQSPALRAMLDRFHKRHPGGTPPATIWMRDDQGRTSYEALIESAGFDGGPQRVLDLGCGDGFLLQQIKERFPRALLAGVDLAPTEIETARQALPKAELETADVTAALPFVDESFDIVISHLVVMLLGNADAPFAQVARVLRPGGTFAFLIDDLTNSPSTYVPLLKEAMRGAGTLRPDTNFRHAADERLHDPDGMRAALSNSGFALRAHSRLTVHGALTKESAWDIIRVSYPIGLLDEEQQERAMRATLEFVANSGEKHLTMPLQVITAERTV
jgi:trans-aconitate methyltransferase